MSLFQRSRETVIETERLILRRWTTRDMQGFLRFAADPEVMITAGSAPVLTEEQARGELRRAVDDPYVLAITKKDTGEILGKIKFQGDFRRYKVNSVSIGYELAKVYWGNGYMPEALRAMVRHAFEVLDVDVVGISHFVGNERSRRVIEKAGFFFEGVIPCAFRRADGVLMDDMSYSILRSEYESGEPAAVRHLM